MLYTDLLSEKNIQNGQQNLGDISASEGSKKPSDTYKRQ